MSDDASGDEPNKVRLAKAVAHETVGKLIGDDAAVRSARKRQAATKAAIKDNEKKER